MEDVDMDVLFTCVEERPVLWDKSSEHYKDRLMKAVAWRSVCEVLKDDFCDLPDDERQEFEKLVIKRWINTRDQWVKKRRENRATLKSGAGSSATKKYVYHDQLSFLERVPGRRRGVTNTRKAEGVTYTEDAKKLSDESVIDGRLDVNKPTASGIVTRNPKQKTSETVNKRKRGVNEFKESNTVNAMVEGDSTVQDQHLIFFKAILPYLKSFSDTQTLDFQMGVLQVIKNVATVNQTPSNQPNTVFGFDRQVVLPLQFPQPPLQHPHPSSQYPQPPLQHPHPSSQYPQPPLQHPHPSSQYPQPLPPQYLQPPARFPTLRQQRISEKLQQFKPSQQDENDQPSVKKEAEDEYDDGEHLSSNEIDDPDDVTDL